MAKHFSELSPKKQEQIHQAALEVFSQNSYKRANTEEIAAKAGISKGLLFYYFKNKQSLYLHLLEWAKQQIENHLKETILQSDDFFERLDFGIEKKLEFFEKNPWLLDFSVRAYYTTDKEVFALVQKYIVTVTDYLSKTYFSNLNTHKFKQGISPQQLQQMLIYLTDGYLHWQMIQQKPLSVSEMLNEYQKWKIILRTYAYKEEYQ